MTPSSGKQVRIKKASGTTRRRLRGSPTSIKTGPELPWGRGMFLGLIEEHEKNKESFDWKAAELVVVSLKVDGRDWNGRKDPDEAGERRLWLQGARLLVKYNDPNSRRFGEGKVRTQRFVDALVRGGLVVVDRDQLLLTPLGRAEVRIFVGSHRRAHAS
jgi:hypothetical protein